MMDFNGPMDERDQNRMDETGIPSQGDGSSQQMCIRDRFGSTSSRTVTLTPTIWRWNPKTALPSG